MEGNLFNGSFPKEIGNLTNLKILQMAYNPFAPQSIPDEFGNLTSLNVLWMTAMNITGEIPNFQRLVNLQQLDLSINLLTGKIPGAIWMLENLQELLLYKNKLSGSIEIDAPIKAIGLQSIDVSNNQLSGSIPDEFGGLKNLSILLLYYNNFTGEIPRSIGLLPSLSDFRAFGNSLTGILPFDFGKNAPLWNIEVNDNSIWGVLPETLCSRGALASIVVFNNNFSGSIPESLGECATLDNLMLQNNRFSGDFPGKIWSAANLSTVILHDNEFSGQLPRKMPWNLTRMEIQNNRFSGKIPSISENLIVFLADNNLFSGDLPVTLNRLSMLQSFSLGGNMISGTIPEEISSLKSLKDLNLSSNQLVGEIPSSISLLPVLSSLDLSSNQLTGKVTAVGNNLKLNFLNLSSNNFYGEVPYALQNQAYDRSFLSNANLCSWDTSLGLSSCGKVLKSSSSLSSGLVAMIIVLGFVIFFVGLFFVFLVVRDYSRRKDGFDHASWKLTSFHSLNFNESIIVKGLVEDNVIGSGGSGMVYKVMIGNHADEVVAVKKIWNKNKTDSKLEREFISEIQILSSIRHANIVKLLCCISSDDSKLLVYQYMKNGSLDRWLHAKRMPEGPPMIRSRSGHAVALDWPRRLGIAIGAARGLSYMHHDCLPPIVHRDVKSSNILLDSEFRARVADFGLARMLVRPGEANSVTAVAGSFGYMAPECAYAAKVNEKMDVYSFGVVLLELTTGREASNGGTEGSLVDWAWHHFQVGNRTIDAIDDSIKDPVYLDDIAKVMKVGLICTGTLPSTRPTMKEVVEMLLSCDQTNWNGEKIVNERDNAPLLKIARSVKGKISSSNEGDEVDYCKL